MIKLKVAPGIRGINDIRSRNRSGWHVFGPSGALGFSGDSFVSTVWLWNQRGYRLIGVQGNTLTFDRMEAGK